MDLKKLYKKFENVGSRPGLGGKNFKYVKGAEVIHRLNECFDGEWSLEIVDVIRDTDDILVHVRLTVWEKDKAIIKEQFGSAQVKRYESGPRKGNIIDYGNAFKSATTDGVKKAASMLGVGLYLYDLDNPIGLENGVEEVESDTAKEVSEDTPSAPPFEDSEPPFEGIPDLNIPETKVEEPKTESTSEDEETNITDIQKCAIENMADMKNTTVAEVIKAAVGKEKPLDKLTYVEAAAAIKHVNSLKTPKK